MNKGDKTKDLRRSIISVFFVLRIFLTTFAAPAYASPEEAFVDGFAKGASETAGVAVVSGAVCLVTAAFAPIAASAVCTASGEVIFGWFG
ncbi:hypothetical protein IQ273_10150 [Nodosilinea sp. LEGE 07298]|uniref:hypothetical protein n=1 Tax=Nodosilinea sp. LEGE 07298 TaxID=2777970 RepID=UPI00187FF899|nr:hypothetical protein [Nodosilinea sp. LEGE 07298]MBE9109772.1 hypothetical protein [Nodosilinea sp. LEGE 07298]